MQLQFVFSTFMFDLVCIRVHLIESSRDTKCGFSLAEERKKWKTFSSHTAGRLGTGVRGVQVTWLV